VSWPDAAVQIVAFVFLAIFVIVNRPRRSSSEELEDV